MGLCLRVRQAATRAALRNDLNALIVELVQLSSGLPPISSCIIEHLWIIL